ncbi:MAG: outer membrane beta-barrel protein [Crocinitomicaceae bacterium]
MKRLTLLSLAVFATFGLFAQEEEGKKADTTRINLGGTELIIIDKKGNDEDDIDIDIDEEDPIEKKPGRNAHWAGVDFGFSVLLNDQMEGKFPNNPYWQNDAAKSQTWNLNLLEHKFKIAQNYVGVTTGLGFSFTSVAFRDNYLLQSTADTLYAVNDSLVYSKNKLKASYLTVPLLLEFNTSNDEDKAFYLAAGVVGGVRIGSKVKRVGEIDGRDFKEKIKGTYGLSSFKVDAALRMGYANWGVFANYSLMPLFDTEKTVEVYPLTFGLSYNF